MADQARAIPGEFSWKWKWELHIPKFHSVIICGKGILNQEIVHKESKKQSE